MIARAFSPAYPHTAAARLKLPERATAIALLLLLHAALLLLINPKFGVQTEVLPLNEITVSFHVPKPKEVAPPAVNPVFIRPTAPAITLPVIPGSNLSPAAPAAPNVTGLGQSLFNCDLANSKNLTREQRAKCLLFGRASSPAATMEAGLPKSSAARHSAIWAAELAARQTPLTVPCTSLQQRVFGGPGLQNPTTTLMADPLCLLSGLLNRFQPGSK